MAASRTYLTNAKILLCFFYFDKIFHQITLLVKFSQSDGILRLQLAQFEELYSADLMMEQNPIVTFQIHYDL